MSLEQLSTLMMLLLGSFSVALLALYGISWLGAREENSKAITLSAEDDDLVFLFDDETLVNATSAAKTVLSAASEVGSDWSRLLSVLITRFPSLQTEIAQLADFGKLAIESSDGGALLNCEWRNGLARIALIDQEAENSQPFIDRHSLTAMEMELDQLRSVAEKIPFPVWKEQEDGTISWANPAYISLADTQKSVQNIAAWPPKTLFKTAPLKSLAPNEMRRLKVEGDETNPKWFDVTRLQTAHGILFAAASADDTVKAETSLREFTQTLTKTFSHLTIGLAVFDKNRNLALFNPALSDLTQLPAEFLVARPALTSFLDRLRDRQMMPEPKDYKTWRHEISALEAAAENGSYEEVWSLPGGLTYRVSGRPHPDGAIAFLFEDISAEMSLTRRFRAEIETSQAVIDSLNEAVAVFSKNGSLVMTNSAYLSLWGQDMMEGVSDISITDATRLWHSKCAPSPIWGDIRDYVGSISERTEWTGTTRLWDGRRLNCRSVPLPSGQTLIGFTPETMVQTGPMVRRVQADPNYVNM